MSSCALRTVAIALVSFAVASSAAAQEVWRGDFETGDTSQFRSELNGMVEGRDYIQIVGDVVAEGMYAARIELHDDAVWPNGLKRVELSYRPADARTSDGSELYFAWSFYLPETLPVDPSQTIGYWESANSWQQVMAFQLRGSDLSFVTRRPSNQVHWTGVVTPGEWHRIAMRIAWSTGASGSVDVWFDGEQVVIGAGAQTLADTNPHFTQIGLLRGAIEFSDVPIIYIDDAVEGGTLADVRPDDLPGMAPPDAGVDAGEPASDGGASDDAGAHDSGTAPADASAMDSGGGGGRDAGGGSGDVDGGCGCRVATTSRGHARGLVLAAIAALALAARRARRRQRSSPPTRSRSSRRR